MMMKVLIGIGAYLFLTRKPVAAAATGTVPPGSAVVPAGSSLLPNTLLNSLLGKSSSSGGGSKGGGGSSSGGGGGGAPGYGTSAGLFPTQPITTPTSYEDPTLTSYQNAVAAYNANQNAPAPDAPALFGVGAPGDQSTAEASQTQDSTLQGILNAPIDTPVLAPQPDTSSDSTYDPASDPSAYIDDGSGGGGGGVDYSGDSGGADLSEF